VACSGLPPGHRRVLADAGDNVGGGSPGDRTTLLAALMEHCERRSLAVLWAPEAVAAIHAQGGDAASVVVGTPPLELSGAVRRLGVVEYRRSGSYMAGQPVSMGRVAVISAPPGTVVLTEERVLPFDRDHLTSAGIDLEEYDVIAVKSAVAWRAAFSDWATDAIVVDSPGYCPTDLARPWIPGLKHCYPVDPSARHRPGGAVTLP
jgi:microcystin degradation protein MlrC